MGNNEILKSIESELGRYKSEFTVIENQIQELIDRREQTRGAYTALYNQYVKFIDNKGEVSVDRQTLKEQTSSNQEIVYEKPISEVVEKPKRSKKVKDENKQEDTERVVAGLSKEEIEKINKAVPQSQMKDANGNEIPDYLQFEYSK